jgi:hypothetical protein
MLGLSPLAPGRPTDIRIPDGHFELRRNWQGREPALSYDPVAMRREATADESRGARLYFGEGDMRNLIIALALCGLLSSCASPTDWREWWSIGDDVSVSYAQITKQTWTWRFRNDGSTDITYMTFTYIDANGEHSDVLPGSLAPGKVYGGWGAYAASSRPMIVIKEIRRE